MVRSNRIPEKKIDFVENETTIAISCFSDIKTHVILQIYVKVLGM